MADYIKKRSDGRYRLNFRVPADLVAAVGKPVMNESLGTADKGEALVKAKAIVENYRSAWNDLRNGEDSAARLRFDAARAIARRHGLPYHSEFADDASLPELLKRVEALVSTTDIQEKVALAGGVRPAVMKLSEIVKEVESHLRVELASKSDKQRHRWRLPRDRAVRNFIAVVGGRAVNAITRDDALDFRDWWAERMLSRDSRFRPRMR